MDFDFTKEEFACTVVSISVTKFNSRVSDAGPQAIAEITINDVGQIEERDSFISLGQLVVFG